MTIHKQQTPRDDSGQCYSYYVANCDECGEAYDEDREHIDLMWTWKQMRWALRTAGWESELRTDHSSKQDYWFDCCDKCCRGIWP